MLHTMDDALRVIEADMIRMVEQGYLSADDAVSAMGEYSTLTVVELETEADYIRERIDTVYGDIEARIVWDLYSGDRRVTDLL